MSFDFTVFLPCSATAEPVRPTTSADDGDNHGRRRESPSNHPHSSSVCLLGPQPIKPAGRPVSFGAMRVWVDCTAAAHPIVLRPIVERLREAGHDGEITAREYGQTVGLLERLGLEHEVIGSHGGAGTAGKGLALAGAAPPSPGGRGRGGLTSRSATARSISPSSARCCASPRYRCRITSTPGFSDSSPSARRAGCSSQTPSVSRP